MTYATRADLEKLYGVDEIAQRESALDDGALDLILGNADALIDGYLAGRYSLPLSSIPSNLLAIAAAIARYNLLGDSAVERHRNDYKDAIAWLRDVEAGRVKLQSSVSPVPGNAPATVVMLAPTEAVFKRSGRP